MMNLLKKKLITKYQLLKPIYKTLKAEAQKTSKCFYSPDCTALQFFSYNRCLDSVNRARGFIFEPVGLKNGESLLFGFSDVIRCMFSAFFDG